MATLRQLARHVKHQPLDSFTLRELLNVDKGAVTVSTRTAPFSIMTQNMALVVFPGEYKGTDRDGAVEEIVTRIKDLSTDVAGLCEVFSDGERVDIKTELTDLYPFSVEGPDKSGSVVSDGGCLLLSKHQILSADKIVYTDSIGADWWANKGVLYIRIKPPNTPRPYEIFYTHAQNIDEPGGQAVLYGQMSELGAFIDSKVSADNPVLVLGDLNIPGNVPAHYQELINRLKSPVDLWLVSGGLPNAGFTLVAANNFYEDPADNPQQHSRLDYILMRSGKRTVPILSNFEILKFKFGGRDLSDHFGIRGTFEEAVDVEF